MHREGTRQWTNDMHGSWDTAIPGNSSLQAALKRALSLECAKVGHEEAFALILLDIEKFYDSIPLKSLIEAGIR